MNIGCAILAGGKSSRMGTDKALLEYDGKHFIEKIAGELSWFEERIIARGNNSGLKGELEREWTVIPDIYSEHGPIGGLHAALAACKSDALFVVTCDMPLIECELARKLCACMQETAVGKEKTEEPSDELKITEEAEMRAEMDGENVDAYDVIISVEADGKIHPLCGVYRKTVIPVLEEQLISGRNRVMEALKKLRVKYVTIDTPAQAQQLANINTPQDYEAMRTRTLNNPLE